MSFRPLILVSGYAGWTFLSRTRPRQQDAFAASERIRREAAYFEANIRTVKTAADLVSNHRLLAVALGAFGLDSDIGNRFFIRKVLEEGTLDPKSLANRLVDKRYRAFARAFGFGDHDPPNTILSDFGRRMTDLYKARQFEAAVAEQDAALGLALHLDRSLPDIARSETTSDARWYLVMGQPQLRQVIQTALGLPSSLVSLPLDRQLSEFKARTQEVFGDQEIAQFADPERREKLLRLYLARASGAGGSALVAEANAGARVALNLLQSATLSLRRQ